MHKCLLQNVTVWESYPAGTVTSPNDAYNVCGRPRLSQWENGGQMKSTPSKHASHETALYLLTGVGKDANKQAAKGETRLYARSLIRIFKNILTKTFL
jgi:hypothetical protein